MKLNISDAARAAGVQRKVIYRKMEKGELSKEIREDGSSVIDLSELARVWPRAANYTPAQGGRAQIPKIHSGNGVQREALVALKDRISALEADKTQLRLDLDRERERGDRERAERERILDLLEKAQLQLGAAARSPAPPPPQPAAALPVLPAAPQRGLWARLTGRA